MAKKKKKKGKGKKQMSASGKLIFLLIIAAIVVVVADSCGDRKIYNQLPPQVKQQIDAIASSVPSIPMPEILTTTGNTYTNLHLPARLYDREEQILHHTGYSLSYNEEWRLANWAGYELTREKTRGTVPRAKHFKPHPQVSVCPTNVDYAHSGYDRGHLVPAGDMKWEATAMEESFYFTNICPQIHNLNAGDWKELEDKVRDWAVKDSAIIVVCGPIVNSAKPRRIGVNKVVVPDAFYKVILAPYATPPRAIGFIMKHEKCNKPLRSYAVTVDSVEKATGIDFFTTLPDEIEEKIEATFQAADWAGI